MRITKLFCAFFLSFLFAGTPVHAQEEYPYTVRVYAGQQGHFSNGNSVIEKRRMQALRWQNCSI